MRFVLIAMLAACEFQPPPKPQPSATVPSAQQARPAAKTETPPAGSGAGSSAAATVDNGTGSGAPAPAASGSGAGSGMEVTAACTTTAERVADVLIASAKDPTLKASYEQAKTRIVRATAEACTTQGWGADAQGCFVAAKDEADLRACEKKFPPPNAPRPRPVDAKKQLEDAKKADQGAAVPPPNAKVLAPKPR